MRKIVLASAAAAFLATGLFAANSFADTGAATRPSPEKMHQSMCADRAAREAGHLAYLEARLNLTTAQKPLFAKYSNAMTASAKTAEQNCLTAPARHEGQPPTIVERQAMIEKMMESKLAELKATEPSLNALYASLDADQKAVLDHQGGKGFRHFADWRGGDRHHGGMDHKTHFGPEGDNGQPGPDAPPAPVDE